MSNLCLERECFCCGNMDVFCDSDDESGCAPVCVFSPAARVPIEETVVTKELERSEEIPTKGISQLNIQTLLLKSLSCFVLLCPWCYSLLLFCSYRHMIYCLCFFLRVLHFCVLCFTCTLTASLF